MRWPEDRLVELTDEQLAAYMAYWKAQGDGYRRARRRVSKDHPDAFRTGYSAWWCSKYASKGGREQTRRLALDANDKRAEES
jgi:hypothetical protein